MFDSRGRGISAIKELLHWMGQPTDSETFRETPRRVIAAWEEMLAGYSVDPKRLLSVTFEADCDEMVTLSNISFHSVCEHHLLPFSGTATVGYIPREGRGVVGISKLARLVDCFSKRLQLQERMTNQIADALVQSLEPKGVGVVVEASHMCMACRGVCKPSAVLRTTALRGVLQSKPEARHEFLKGVE